MIILLYLVFLSSNFLFIKSEVTGNVTINIKSDDNCVTGSSDYTFTEGQNVTLVVTPHMHIDHGWWALTNGNVSKNLYSDLRTTETHEENKPYEPILHTSLVNKSMEGTWEFTFYIYRNNTVYQQGKHLPTKFYNGSSFSQSVCRTNIKIAPKPVVPQSYKEFLITACVVGAILLTINIAQAAYIILLKAKARELITLNTHNNLSKKTEPVANDTARYCSNPGQKMMKVAAPVDDDNRDSAIYEAPNIEISENTRMPNQPPQPPAITTMPRTPRPDHNNKIGLQAMLSSAFNSPARSPKSDHGPPNFQRQKLEREVNIANRPPLPLPSQAQPHQGHPHQGHPHQGHPHQGHPHQGHPHQGHPYQGHPHQGHPYPSRPHNDMFQEVYEEMEPEEQDIYEPPPVISAAPPRLPVPPKKVPVGNLLEVKENTLKMIQGNKPIVTPKPNVLTCNEFEQALRRRNNDTMPKPNTGHMSPMQQELAMRKRANGDAPPNELEEALRRRNNVMKVPIVSIPDPSRAPPKPKLLSKPRGPPVHQPVQEEIYFNENQASSDEEWIYEPLKPLDNYDKNLYNI